MKIIFVLSAAVVAGTCPRGGRVEFYDHGIQVPANDTQVGTRSFLGGGCNPFGTYPSGATFMLANRLTSGPEYNSTVVGSLLVVALKLSPSKVNLVGQFKGNLNVQWITVFPSSLDNTTRYLVRGGSGDFRGALGNGTGTTVNRYYFGYNSVTYNVMNLRYPDCELVI